MLTSKLPTLITICCMRIKTLCQGSNGQVTMGTLLEVGCESCRRHRIQGIQGKVDKIHPLICRMVCI